MNALRNAQTHTYGTILIDVKPFSTGSNKTNNNNNAMIFIFHDISSTIYRFCWFFVLFWFGYSNINHLIVRSRFRCSFYDLLCFLFLWDVVLTINPFPVSKTEFSQPTVGNVFPLSLLDVCHFIFLKRHHHNEICVHRFSITTPTPTKPMAAAMMMTKLKRFNLFDDGHKSATPAACADTLMRF